MNHLAVFDCDGTLVDSQANICDAMEETFTRAGLAVPDREAVRRIVGLSLVEAVRELHPLGDAALHQAMAQDYKSCFHALRGRGLVSEPLFDGIAETIAALDADGWLLGVATGKSDRGLNLCLAHHAIADRFVTLQTADRHPSKPHPSMLIQAMADAGAAPATTVMIGDTRYDIAMAKAVGATAIGVAWGYHDAAELHAEGADRVARHPQELIEMLKEMR
ncbi:phosphoglycolate phosphatase [Sphingomonas laterariae]|uniref:Phosphoglycolate phosphatase n=1 Tax=Edaphosphingomonas laterariae TaxID=861865 RepID=A0A239EE74_9SPHN|nr:HAD-IA family hydrolase [Sphingomonas laterariae]SNS42204.1 phosphoglycolate phosphatase [Sphingomonas laterariae]